MANADSLTRRFQMVDVFAASIVGEGIDRSEAPVALLRELRERSLWP